MADRLRAGIAASPNAHLGWDTQTNELFPVMARSKADGLREKGAVILDWNPPRVATMLGHQEALSFQRSFFCLKPSYGNSVQISVRKNRNYPWETQ